MKKIYLASRYGRREELKGYRNVLESMGYKITSRWLNGNHEIKDGQSEQVSDKLRVKFAEEDWADLLEADIVISFTEIPRSTNSRGGRHVEFGAGLALGKVNLVCGPRENIFHYLKKM